MWLLITRKKKQPKLRLQRNFNVEFNRNDSMQTEANQKKRNLNYNRSAGAIECIYYVNFVLWFDWVDHQN